MSLRTASRVTNSIKCLGHSVETIDLNEDTIDLIEDYKPDLIWLIHGDLGEDGSLQDLLQTLGYSYVGSNAQGCRMAFN